MDASQFAMDTCRHCVSAIQSVPPSLLLLFVLTSVLGFAFLLYVVLFIAAPFPREPLAPEKCYITLDAQGAPTKPKPLPCWQDKLHTQRHKSEKLDSVAEASGLEEAELFMSVVVPAYNEEARLVEMMEEAVSFLEDEYGLVQEKKRGRSLQNGTAHGSNGQAGRANGSATTLKGNINSRGWEIVIVSDGSTDKTVETALKFVRDNKLYEGLNEECIRVVSLNQNRGKGGAVVHGMKHVRGQYVVFADADGASKFQDLRKLVSACQDVEDTTARGIAVGSRAHLVGSAAVVQRSFLRNFLMHSFHLLLRILTPPATAKIRDTQCGFKLFSRPTLPYIIPHMHSEGWIFDVEMLMLAEYASIPVAEVPVGWREVKGSKLNAIWDSLGMAWSLAVLRAAWGFGVYRRS